MGWNRSSPDLLFPTSFVPMMDGIDLPIPNAFTTWQLWQSDVFDQDVPLTLQKDGTNILHGLYELWFYTLKEGILDNGSASFSYFHLTWENTAVARADVAVNPFGNLSLLKLRRWAGFNLPAQAVEDGQIIQRLDQAGNAVLFRLAQLHYELLRKSDRWKASAIDWGAEARELLARVEPMADPKEL